MNTTVGCDKPVRVGVIGLGCRGPALIHAALLPNEHVKITAVCDVYPDRVDKSLAHLREAGQDARGFTDYRALLESGETDAVIVATAWESHVEIACAAMRAGIAVGMEVGGALHLADCQMLVDTWEETKTPFMFLENCNYDRRETALFAMIEEGLFGEVVACDGGYMHDLRTEVAGGERNRHYRLRNYQNRNCENYPTHELGPIARMLRINRGNRMVSLVSVASSAKGLHDYMVRKEPNNPHRTDRFAQGDVVTTVITCAGGETITLRLDTTLPRYYCRGLTVHGTRAFYSESNNTLYVDGEHDKYDFRAKEIWGNFTEYAKPYRNDNWRAVDDGFQAEGHGGMDYFMMKDFIDRLRTGEPMPIDVYDGASMMCIAPLSATSIAAGGAPQAVPDYTKGAWRTRKS